MEQVSEGYSLEQHVEGESRHLGAPILRLDIAKEIDELRRGGPWNANGHTAKTLVKYPSLRAVLVLLKRGARLEGQKSANRLSIHTIEGHVLVRLAEQDVDLHASCLLGLEKLLTHDVEAVEDSAILLTLSV